MSALDIEQDPSLVPVIQCNEPQFFALSVLLTFACLTERLGGRDGQIVLYKAPFAFTTSEANIADVVKAMRTIHPDIAIVGSSLSRRLEPGLFPGVIVINLGLGGGSVATGLEVLKFARPLSNTLSHLHVLLVISCLGVCLAVPAKRQLINIEQLPYPSVHRGRHHSAHAARKGRRGGEAGARAGGSPGCSDA